MEVHVNRYIIVGSGVGNLFSSNLRAILIFLVNSGLYNITYFKIILYVSFDQAVYSLQYIYLQCVNTFATYAITASLILLSSESLQSAFS